LANVLVSQITEASGGEEERLSSSDMMVGQPVKMVDYTEETVKVFVENSGDTFYKCSHVIIAVPLGVLKKNHREMFTPRLTTEKIEAIEKIEFGRVGKVFLRFDKPWWAQGEEGLKIVWTKEEMLGKKATQDDWYKAFLGFDEVLNCPNWLVGWIGGKEVEIMESLEEAVVVNQLGNLIRRSTGDSSLPDPSQVIRTSWVSDPNFLGTYSFPGLKTEVPKHQLDLAEPLVDENGTPRVLFCGEATHPDSYSTVHGARQTGLREAARLLPFLRQN